MSGGAKALIAALVVVVVAAVAVVVVIAVGAHDASNKFSAAVTARPGRPGGYHGAAYPGMLVQDHVGGGAGTSIDVSGETLTAGELTRTASFLGPTLCSPVTIVNHAQATEDIGPTEWKLQQPDGIVETFAITGTLSGGQIAPGGQARGTVCFADRGQSGTFVLLWQPFLRVGRGVWLLQL
jgi:aspartate ammonia-lyase